MLSVHQGIWCINICKLYEPGYIAAGCKLCSSLKQPKERAKHRRGLVLLLLLLPLLKSSLMGTVTAAHLVLLVRSKVGAVDIGRSLT